MEETSSGDLMQTRRLRLGDVVDDYCPRERRLSNHVIVAMVEDAIKQTRCTTCDFEHPYKEGKLPARRKKKDATAALYQQVLDGMTEKPPVAPSAPIVADEAITADPPPVPSEPLAARPAAANLRSGTRTRHHAAAATIAADVPAVAESGPTSPPAPPSIPSMSSKPSMSSNAEGSLTAASSNPASSGADGPSGIENEPLHRRTLIRATLPRPVGEVPARQAPTFTIREAARAPKFRRPFGRNARPQGGQAGQKNGGGGAMGRSGSHGPQARGKKGGSPQQGVHHFGQGHGHSHGQGGHQGAHHTKGRQGNQGNKRFK
jgi:hypothetical protein